MSVSSTSVAARSKCSRNDVPDVAHIDRLTPLARQARQLSAYLVGDLARLNVDFSREFRYRLETDLARFTAIDRQFLLTGHRYYPYSENLDAVSPAELCCHTLLIDDGSRHRPYCLLLLSHVDIDEENLREQAVTYGLEDEIDASVRSLETQGKTDRLPEWDEF